MPRQPTHHRTPLFSRPVVVVAASMMLASTALAQQPPASEPAPTQAPATAVPQPESAPVKAEASASLDTGSPAAEASTGGEEVALSAPTPEPTSATDYAYIPVHSERRSGFMFGALVGPVLSFAQGTPIKVNKRDQVADTGAALGMGFSLFIGGAFTDWFTFKIGMSNLSSTAGDLKTEGTGVIFGVETWPLFSRGGVFRDLGVGIDFGTGAARVFNKNDDKNTLADGSGYSMIRGNVFWDALQLGPINLGPSASYEYKSKDTYSEHSALIALRAVFYGGP